MRHILLILIPLLAAMITVLPLMLLATDKQPRLFVKMSVFSIFLFLSFVVGEVVAPGVNQIINGEFHSDIGLIGFLERIIISSLIYFCIVIALCKSIKFKSYKSMLFFILFSSTIYGIVFEIFIQKF